MPSWQKNGWGPHRKLVSKFSQPEKNLTIELMRKNFCAFSNIVTYSIILF
ncbi:Uncharacterized protein dnm_020690 [Desulfonema magnum]|uniref:Uncharacterized protein n=1 Tax=Desulfonema magnum TaxID=45655 RepID=A0A975GLP3_9BACT|nr:Uncharacterized protein dnm_020690 [Desulfonema magnum]